VAESYPNECWTFDHAIAIAALRCADAVDGTDPRALCESWVAMARQRLVDRAFAEDQYPRARSELGRTPLGFSWSREWPTSWRSPGDINSGAVIPLLDVSAGGSGMAFIAAASLGDHDYFQKLRTTLDFAAILRWTIERVGHTSQRSQYDVRRLGRGRVPSPITPYSSGSSTMPRACPAIYIRMSHMRHAIANGSRRRFLRPGHTSG